MTALVAGIVIGSLTGLLGVERNWSAPKSGMIALLLMFPVCIAQVLA